MFLSSLQWHPFLKVLKMSRGWAWLSHLDGKGWHLFSHLGPRCTTCSEPAPYLKQSRCLGHRRLFNSWIISSQHHLFLVSGMMEYAAAVLLSLWTHPLAWKRKNRNKLLFLKRNTHQATQAFHLMLFRVPQIVQRGWLSCCLIHPQFSHKPPFLSQRN